VLRTNLGVPAGAPADEPRASTRVLDTTPTVQSTVLRATRFARFAWGVLAFDLLVVAWGAYVRATGSGAGCGRHWPTCQGQIVPRAPRVETLIELSHRLSSGGALLLTVGLLIGAVRAFPPRHRVRRAATAAVVLMVTEALIGAGLVLLELVAHDASIARAASTVLHLGNTFLLLAATALTAWWASGGPAPETRGQRAVVAALAPPLAAMLVVGATGAVTALGDTLFPSRTLAAGLAQDFSPSAHVFVRLRVVHPVLAMFTAAAIVVTTGLVRSLRPSPSVRVFSLAAGTLAALQVAAGILDVLTFAPVAVQLLHLVLADSVWIALVLTAASALGVGSTSTASSIASPTATGPATSGPVPR
jgi:heme A synthase